jgi:L-ascorbate metabolism protein UlaG (beta-lactamase superfamily)
MKPHIRSGRFYNNPHDQIRTRLGHVIRMAWCAFIQTLRGKRTEQAILDNVKLSDWLVKPTWQPTSKEPVITWLGHATFLIQIDGINIITDPIFYDMSRVIKRLLPCPINPKDLPPIHVILLSHNHADHTDEKSLNNLRHHNPIILVPQGDKQWFERRNVANVHELTWGDTRTVGQTTLTFLPASHWSGRHLFNINRSLWGSWLVRNDNSSIYFAGDSAYSGHFATIGRTHGPIDIALMGIAPHTPRELMFDAHMSPHEAVQAFIDLDATQFIPMHWGTIMFGLDTFDYPIQQLHAYWHERRGELQDKQLHTVKCGQTLPLTWQPAHQASAQTASSPSTKQIESLLP